jgi:hypothetical protein
LAKISGCDGGNIPRWNIILPAMKILSANGAGDFFVAAAAQIVYARNGPINRRRSVRCSE